MKKLSLLFLAAFLFLTSGSFAQQVFVSPSGSNLNDGTITRPWKTLEYALSKVTMGEILLGAGHYYVNDGAQFAPFGWCFPQGLVVTSQTGNASDVIISGPSTATGYDFKVVNNTEGLTFRAVSFENTPASSVFIGSFGTGVNVRSLTFDRCIFNMSTKCQYLFVLSNYQGLLQGLNFTGCTINTTKDPEVGILVSGKYVDNINFVGNTCNVKNGLIRLTGAKNSRVDDNLVTVTGVAGTGLIMCYGDTSLNVVFPGSNNTMSRNRVISVGAKYAHLMGAGKDQTTIFDSNIIEGDIWIKANSSSRITNNVILGGIEVKGCSGFSVINNSVTTKDSTCIILISGDTQIAPSIGWVYENYLKVTGAGKCYSMLNYNIGESVLVNANILEGKIGDIMDTLNTQSLAGAQNAWAGYDYPYNDSISSHLTVTGVPWNTIRK